eukprot:5851449-Heterocapsa_arctica.AAC.1
MMLLRDGQPIADDHGLDILDDIVVELGLSVEVTIPSESDNDLSDDLPELPHVDVDTAIVKPITIDHEFPPHPFAAT